MFGWWGKLLRINLSANKVLTTDVNGEILTKFLGGRGLAAYILWNELEAGVDPLSPDNKLVIAAGPLTGLPLPSSGKLVIASKSPLTYGYGDGNIGTKASVNLRRAGYDAIVIEGRASKPSIIYIEDGEVDILPADDLWGLTTIDTEQRLIKNFGEDVGILTIGPAGENLVRYASVISEYGRSGGRPGMGAVMGSKNLKAIVIRGSKDIPTYNFKELTKIAEEAYNLMRRSDNYEFWIRQGTMSTIEWANSNSCLPTFNFREGVFDEAVKISGNAMERIKIRQKGCPYCEIPCGNIVKYIVNGLEGEAELDYENVAMLGANIGLGDLSKVSDLNYIADAYGLDTISLGNVLGYTIELSEKGLINEKISWGDYYVLKEMISDITYRRGIGNELANGVRYVSLRIGSEAVKFAMHIKGLEISAYDCHAAPGMALAYGTSSIGAHHKDAWFIATELKLGRFGYTKEKVERLIWLQNIRGGLFESLTVCRFPWLETSLNLEYYLKFLESATGVKYSWDDVHILANRVYSLIRAIWIREYVATRIGWSRQLDIPPSRWFNESLSKGPLAGSKLDLNNYETMLGWYYELRGWDFNGIPRRSTLETLGLSDVAEVLDRYVGLST